MQEKLAAAGIRILDIELDKHWMVERDGFVALVAQDGCRAGAAGRLTEKGLAPLMWREGQAAFVAKGVEQPATPDDIERLRRFQEDLESALQ